MRLIFKIARTELRNIFYSPIAWFLTIAFLVQSGITYVAMLEFFAQIQESGGISARQLSRLTQTIFSNPQGGLFSNIMQNLYLYIPLLTMGIISKEFNGSTISLLYSSPISVKEIVFGKYVSMMIYNLLLIAVIAIFMVSGVFQISNPDSGILWSATLGFYLLLCTYAAIGLFMSSLTNYQVVAAISTFIVIGILSRIGELWQNIDFIRDLTYFLSLNGRTQHMMAGLITTKDVLYFIIIIGMFLGFTVYKLKNTRESRPVMTKAMRYITVILLALITGYITSRQTLTGYWDTTANKDNTLPQNAQKIIKELGDSTLEVTAYGNFLDDYAYWGAPDYRNAYIAEWEPYLRFKPEITFEFIRYYDIPYAADIDIFTQYPGKTLPQIVDQRLRGSGMDDITELKTPEQIHAVIDLRPEMNRFVMQLKYRGRTTFLRVFNDPQSWPGPAEVCAALRRLQLAKMPKIGFVTGDLERSTARTGDRDYMAITNNKTFRYALNNQGFDVDTVSLTTKEVPDDITTLVIADPRTALSAVATDRIGRYIAKGGNLLIAGEPGRQALLNPLLRPLGVQLTAGMLQQQSLNTPPYLVRPQLTKTAIDRSPLLKRPSIDTLPVLMPGAAGLTFVDTGAYTIRPLLMTDPKESFNSNGRNPDLDLVGQEEDSSHGPQNNVTDVKLKKSYPATVALTRTMNGREQRIIVSGDADFMSNQELGRRNVRGCNFVYSVALFSWLNDGNFPIETSRPEPRDNSVTVSTRQVKVLKIVYIWALPAILLAFSTILLIRRRRK